MVDLKNKSVGLIGYGTSNQAMCAHLLKKGIMPTVRDKDACCVPSGLKTVFGGDYLLAGEDIVFRSPGVRPDKICTRGQVFTEASYGLDLCNAYKIGVTGSDGKTTTSTLIYRMLCVGNKNAFLGGNIGKPIVSIADRLAQGDFLVAELSSFQLMDMEPCLDVAAVTNITENHLDWHTHMGEYVGAKAHILKNAKRRVLNYDDPLVRSLAKADVYFSLNDRRKMLGKCDFVHIVNGQVCYNDTPLFPVSDICLKGQFNVQNVLCALGCTYNLVDKKALWRVAREFCGVENRMESVLTLGGVEFVCSAIDSTPSRTVKTLSAFDLSRTVCILGGYDKNLSYECLRAPLSQAKGVVLCGENRDKIAACVNRRVTIVNTLEEAVAAAYGIATDGDTVILTPASASFDMFKNYREKASAFKRAVNRMQNAK